MKARTQSKYPEPYDLRRRLTANPVPLDPYMDQEDPRLLDRTAMKPGSTGMGGLGSIHMLGR